jgi:hypothetical protein
LDFLLVLFGFALGALVGAFILGNMVISLFYGLPVGLWHVIKGEMHIGVVFHFLMLPLFWTVISIGFGYVTYGWARPVYDFMQHNFGFIAGQWVTLAMIGWSFLTPGGRRGMREDFYEVAERYLKAKPDPSQA